MIRQQEARLIRQIAERAESMYARLNRDAPARFIEAELIVVHDEIIPLRLAEFLVADEGNFAHDIAGIHEHLEIGKPSRFSRGFCPRFADV